MRNSAWQWLTQWENSHQVRFNLIQNHPMQITDGECLHLSSSKDEKNEVIRNKSNGESTTSLCSLSQWLITLSVSRKKKLTFPIWIFIGFDFRHLFLLFFSLLNHRTISVLIFLTRRDPIHSAMLVPLILFLISRTGWVLSLSILVLSIPWVPVALLCAQSKLLSSI